MNEGTSPAPRSQPCWRSKTCASILPPAAAWFRAPAASISRWFGETLGLVGESGSGKSVTVQAVMGLITTPGEIVAGDIRWKGRSLLDPAAPVTSRPCGAKRSR